MKKIILLLLCMAALIMSGCGDKFAKEKEEITKREKAAMAMQLPVMFNGIILNRNLGSLPGFFGHLFTLIAIILLYRRNIQIEQYRHDEVKHLKEQHQASRRLFEQTATALVSAIDAKDPYSHGHSLRVAEYSGRIGKITGKDEQECMQIYYAALLHDVG